MQRRHRFALLRFGYAAIAVALAGTQPATAVGEQHQSEPSARVDPARHEVLDRASAQSLANVLVPIVAEDVVDAERNLIRSLPGGDDVALLYRFRLRSEPVPLRPFCRMRIVALSYELAERRPGGDLTVQDLDLLALKRAGRLGRGGIETHNLYLPLEPATGSEEERRARCEAADRNQGWLPEADDGSFANALWHLTRLREALADGRQGPTLRCWRRNSYGCPVSRDMILDAIEGERRSFDAIMLADRSGWAQFTYRDDVPSGGSGETRSIIIELRSGNIASVTLAYDMVVRVVR